MSARCCCARRSGGQREQFGDGAATAAILYQTVYAEGHRFINAGGNAMLLRQALEAGMKSLLEDLRRQVRAVSSQEEIERVALSICGDSEIAATLADIFDVLGPHGAIEVRDGGRDLQHEFFLGSFWESRVPSNIVFEGVVGERIELRKTAWLISDFELDDLGALVKLVTDVYQAGLRLVGRSWRSPSPSRSSRRKARTARWKISRWSTSSRPAWSMSRKRRSKTWR